LWDIKILERIANYEENIVFLRYCFILLQLHDNNNKTIWNKKSKIPRMDVGA